VLEVLEVGSHHLGDADQNDAVAHTVEQMSMMGQAAHSIKHTKLDTNKCTTTSEFTQLQNE
jgi:hypothetical protein